MLALMFFASIFLMQIMMMSQNALILSRSLSEKHKTYTSILADLQGPKLRVGVIEEGAVVAPGDTVEFITTEPFEGNAKQAYMTYQRFPKDVTAGEKILLDDGKLIFEVVSTDKKEKVIAKVLQGGPFKSKKGSTFLIQIFLYQL